MGIICLLMGTGLQEGFATVTNDLGDPTVRSDSSALIRQNTRILERITEFITECITRMPSEPSLVLTCDSFVQKFNIDFAKFLAEKTLEIEQLVYPYTVPSTVSEFIRLSSSNVTASNDRMILTEHASITLEYFPIVQEVSEECSSRLASYDLNAAQTCMGIMKSLNTHLRTFNENAKPEFEKVLDMGISNNGISGSPNIDMGTSNNSVFEQNLPPVTVGDRQASLYTKFSPPTDNNQDAFLQLRLLDSKTGNNITNVNYFLNISKGDRPIFIELFYSKEGPLTIRFEHNQAPVTIHGSTEPFLGGWTSKTGQITASGLIFNEGGSYHLTVEIFGIDNVRNIFVPDNAPRFDTDFLWHTQQ